MQARLGLLIVDERDGILAQGEERLLLNQKAVELLIRLGRAGGKPIRRESLRCELWPDREVSDKVRPSGARASSTQRRREYPARAVAAHGRHLLEAAASHTPAFAEAAMMVATTLRRVKRAITWFRVATAHSTAWALYAAALPILAPIREEAAFQALLRGRGMASAVR